MKKIILFLSAFVPMFFLIIIKDLIYMLLNNEGQSKSCACLIIMFAITIVITVLYAILLNNNKSVGDRIISVNSVKNNTEKYFLGYFSLFILSVYNVSFLNLTETILMAVILILMGIVYIKNNLFYINPLYFICRYYIYEIEYNIEGQDYSTFIFSQEKIKKGDSIYLSDSDYDFTFSRKI